MVRTSRHLATPALALTKIWSPQLLLQTLILVAALTLVGCGGGSNSKSPTEPQMLSTAAVASQSYELINRARSDQGVSELVYDDRLSTVARRHSEAMRDRGFFSHTDPEGNGLRSRLRAHGVSFSSAGENLALVNDSSNPAGLAHQQLMGSPEHRDVMLARRFVRVGVGVAQNGSNFWITQVYLKP